MAWGVLFIAGHSRILRLRGKPNYESHRWWQLGALGLAAAAAVSVLVGGNFGYVSKNYSHPWWGLLAFSAALLQPVLILSGCSVAHRFSGKLLLPLLLLYSLGSGLHVAVDLWDISPMLYLVGLMATLALFSWWVWSLVWWAQQQVAALASTFLLFFFFVLSLALWGGQSILPVMIVLAIFFWAGWGLVAFCFMATTEGAQGESATKAKKKSVTSKT